jgi:DNA primase
MLDDLRAIRGSGGRPAERPTAVKPPAAGAPAEKPTERNVPLARSENERTRELVRLPEEFVTDVAEMSPAASRYFRQRPYLTPEMCRKWNVGYLPSSAKGTMRGRVTYGIESEGSELLAFVGRDSDYESNRAKWEKNRSDEEPMKHRFPSAKFFRRGLELYGQQIRRLDEPSYRDKIAEIGILVVEGMNDVIRLDADGVPAVGLMSNEITDEQVAKIVRWARRLAGGKVALMLDNDDRGREGAKSTLWKLARQTPVVAADYPADEPEHLSSAEIEVACQSLIDRWRWKG